MFCKFCGDKIGKNDKFCSKCGKSQEEQISTINVNELGKGRAIASLVIGIVSILLCTWFFPLPIIGLILGFSYKGRSSEKTIGIVLNIISLIISVLVTIFISLVFLFILVIGTSDDEINNFMIEDISEWNKYSSYMENDILDISTNIVGNWKELSNNRSYLVFGEEEFYFYDDINDLENNYMNGTYTIYNGKEALNKMNINSGLINKIIDSAFNKAIDEDFYIIQLNPLRTIRDGNEIYKEYTEDELNRALFIKKQDNVVELTVSGFEHNALKHYYKVLESNE